MSEAWILVATGVLLPVLALALTPAPRRRDGVAGFVAAGVLVALAGVVFALVADGASLDAADAPVLGWLVERREPAWTTLAEGLALFGGTTFTGGLAVLSAALLAYGGRRVRAVCWVVAVAFGAATIRLLKEAVERPRPPVATRLAAESTSSLPSGHSLMAALGLGLTAAAVLAVRRDAWRGVAVTLAVLLAGAIGVSRAYLGVHWTTDVLSGWLLGLALVVLAATVARTREPVGAGVDRSSVAEGNGHPDDRAGTVDRSSDPSTATPGGGDPADRRPS